MYLLPPVGAPQSVHPVQFYRRTRFLYARIQFVFHCNKLLYSSLVEKLCIDRLNRL